MGPVFLHNRVIGDCYPHLLETMLPVTRSVCLMTDWPKETCGMATMFSGPHIRGYFLWSNLKSMVYDNWPQRIAVHQGNDHAPVCSHCTGNTVTCAIEYGTLFMCVSTRAGTSFKIYCSKYRDISGFHICVILWTCDILPHGSVVSIQVH
jgi:hypothetical protein